jgi:hypothetical protein
MDKLAIAKMNVVAARARLTAHLMTTWSHLETFSKTKNGIVTVVYGKFDWQLVKMDLEERLSEAKDAFEALENANGMAELARIETRESGESRGFVVNRRGADAAAAYFRKMGAM